MINAKGQRIILSNIENIRRTQIISWQDRQERLYFKLFIKHADLSELVAV